MPVWTSIDAGGFGSPMPLMYHKLFYAIAGVVALGTGTMKGAVVTTLALFLMVGATGVFQAVRELGASRLATAVGGCSLIAASYTVTNWLVRGAVAEFAAAMLVPWVLLCLCRTITLGRAPAVLGLVLGLLWLSHLPVRRQGVLPAGEPFSVRHLMP